MKVISPAMILARAGSRLYGRHWIPQLSAALHITDGEVRQWMRGRPIPATIWAELAALLRHRSRELVATDRAIERYQDRLNPREKE
jgi:hypothetical protein